MIYICNHCNHTYFTPTCSKCGPAEAKDHIPLDPKFYPEFQYQSKGLIKDLIVKRKEVHQVAQRLSEISGADYQELVLQQRSMEPMHAIPDRRMRPEELAQHYILNENLIPDQNKTIVIMDDLITTGTHFKAMKSVIQVRFPQQRIVGLFFARRIF